MPVSGSLIFWSRGIQENRAIPRGFQSAMDKSLLHQGRVKRYGNHFQGYLKTVDRLLAGCSYCGNPVHGGGQTNHGSHIQST